MLAVFREALACPAQIMLTIAEVDGSAVAYSNSWTVYSVWSMGMALTVDDLYVLPDYRRLGVGEKIMEYLNAYAAEKGYKRLQLHAETDNLRAHQLYRKIGFTEEGMLFFMKKV